MSRSDFFPVSTTILRMPTWLVCDIAQDHRLPHALGDYKVTPAVGTERWTATLLKTGGVVYSGVGLVEVLRSQSVVTP